MHSKLARYGLSVADVNQVTETLAVGHAEGAVLEGERRFGIVVKTQHGFEGELEPLASLPMQYARPLNFDFDRCS